LDFSLLVFPAKRHRLRPIGFKEKITDRKTGRPKSEQALGEKIEKLLRQTVVAGCPVSLHKERIS
jgi:hypothetical protein